MKKSNALKWIFSNSKRFSPLIALVSVLSGISALGYILVALVSKNIIDIAAGAKNGDILRECILLFSIIIGEVAFSFINSYLKARIAGKLDIHLKTKLLKIFTQKDYSHASQYHSGDILNRFTSDIDIVISNMVSFVPNTVSMVSRLIAGLIVLWTISPLITVIALVCGGGVAIASRAYSKHFKYLHKECQQTSGVARSFLQECIENLMVIKCFVSQKPLNDKLTGYLDTNYKKKITRNNVSNIASALMMFTFSAGYYAILVYGAIMISKGDMTYGTLTAFLSIISQIRAPITGISGLMPQLFSATASAERLMEIENLDDESGEEVLENPAEFYDSIKSICAENLGFSYDGRNTVIDKFFTRIKRGSLTAIIGDSGIGKSTLFKMLLGLFPADSGSLYFETTNGKDEIAPRFRSLFAYVPQGNMILSGSVRENIVLFNPNVSDEDIKAAAKTAEIDEFIESLPEKYDTLIGERGLGLSEGQIQRIAIARAILSGAPILLLDECTSALDETTEEKLLNNIKGLKDKTALIISHRPAVLNICDDTVKFERK